MTGAGPLIKSSVSATEITLNKTNIKGLKTYKNHVGGFNGKQSNKKRLKVKKKHFWT